MIEYLKANRQSSTKDILEELALAGFKEKLMELLCIGSAENGTLG